MDDDLHHQIRTSLVQMPTEDLLSIWCGNDRYEWSDTTFEIIREILLERHIELPLQGSPAYQEHALVITEAHAMSQNPPPILAGSDSQPVTPEPQSVLVRPKTVSYAVALGVAVLAIRAIQLSAAAATGQFGSLLALLAAGSVVLVAFEVWLLRGVWLGSNRRRIVYIGWFVLAMISVLVNGGWRQSFAEQPIRAAILMLANGLDLVAVVLLLLPRTAAWYQYMSKTKLALKSSAQAVGRRVPRRSALPSWLWALTPDAWIKSYTPRTAGILLGTSLLTCWLVFNAALKLQNVGASGEFIDTYFNAMYGMFCLPVQAIVLALAALLAQAGKSTAQARWRGTAYAVWIIGAVLILLTLFAARTLPYTGS